MNKKKIEILRNISETVELWKKYNEVYRVAKYFDCPKYNLKVTAWNHYDHKYETVEVPLRGGIDWIEHFEKTIKELESKLDSLGSTLNDDKDKEQDDKDKKQLDLFDKLTKISALVNENDFTDFIKEADSVYIRDAKDDDGEAVFTIIISSSIMCKSKALFFKDKQSRDTIYQDLLEIQSAIGSWRK